MLARLAAACAERGGDASAPLSVPQNFVRTAPVYNPSGARQGSEATYLIGSPQTDQLLALLELSHRITVPYRDPTANDAPVATDGSCFFLDRGQGESLYHVVLFFRSAASVACQKKRPAERSLVGSLVI